MSDEIKGLEFTFYFKPYHGDVDDYAVLYHANYLRYFEYARSEVLDGFQLGHLCFAVQHLSIDYIKPIIKGQRVRITSQFSLGQRPMILQTQQAMYDAISDVLLSKMSCQLVGVNKAMSVIRIDKTLKALLKL